jgi:hypothetical protein
MPLLKDGSILLNDWARGDEPSYLADLKNIQCLDILTVPGVLFANQKLEYMGVDTASYTGRTFTVDTGAETLTPSLMAFTNFQAVRLTTTGTLPAPFAINTTYYVFGISGSTMKLATTLVNAIAGTAIDITDSGTGTHTVTGVILGRIKKIVQNSGSTSANFRYFAIDEAGRVWVQIANIWSHLSGNAAGAGQGLEIWKGYLFTVGDNGVISTYGPLSSAGGAAAWTGTWKTATGNDPFTAPTIAGSDDILYIAQGRYLSSVEEATAPFEPGTSGSYTWVDTALTLPSGYRVRCMCENGVDLAIGTWMGTTYGTVTIFEASLEVKKADLFFWDRSDTTFRIPVHIEENGVNQVISLNNFVYAVCGYEGRIYITNGTSAELFTQIPPSVFDYQQNTTQHAFFFPNAIAHHRGRIMIGLGSGDAAATATISPLGIYAIDPKTGVLSIENIAASGNTGASGSVNFGAILSISENNLLVGMYYDGSQTFPGSISRITASTTRYGTGAFFESGLYSVGSSKEKATYRVVEFGLGKALNAGEQIRLSFRNKSNGSYTTVCTLDSSTVISDGSTTKYQIETPLLANLTDAQFKVELICTDIFTSPELIYVNIKKEY